MNNIFTIVLALFNKNGQVKHQFPVRMHQLWSQWCSPGGGQNPRKKDDGEWRTTNWLPGWHSHKVQRDKDARVRFSFPFLSFRKEIYHNSSRLQHKRL